MVNFLHLQRRCPCLLNAFLTFEKFPKIWRCFEIFKSPYILEIFEFEILRQQFSLLWFSMFVVQIWCLYLVNQLLYGVLPETTFLTKTAEHDLSLTSITFDLG